MSNKHYTEQKMLIENFRKWEKQSELKEDILQEDPGTLLQALTVSTGLLYTFAPYLKIAVHHPKVQSALLDGNTESSSTLRAIAIGLKGADNAGQWLQNYADKIYSDDAGLFQRLKNMMAIFAFLSVLSTTSFPILGSMLVRTMPKVTLLLKRAAKSAREKSAQLKAKIKGEPTPEQIEMMDQEIDELEDLELEKQEAQQAATAVAEVMDMIKEDPLKIANELGVELSPEDLKNMKLD